MSNKMIKNKTKQFALTAISMAVLSTTVAVPKNSYALFGVGDVNIMEVANFTMKMYEVAKDWALKQLDNISKTVENAFKFSQEVDVENLKEQIATERATMPSPDACERIIYNKGAIVATGGGSAQHAKQASMAVKKQQTSGTAVNQLSEKRKLALTVGCTEEDTKRGINGCGLTNVQVKPTWSAGQDRNPNILSGAVFKEKQGKNGNEKTYSTGNTVPRAEQGFLDPRLNSKKFHGEEAQQLFIGKISGERVLPIENPKINSEGLGGATFNAEVDKFNGRIGVAEDVLQHIAAKSLAMSESGEATKPIKVMWDQNKKLIEDMIRANGVEPALTKMPSEDHFVKLLAMKDFTELNTAKGAVGGNKEVPLLVINNYLTAKLLEEQINTNKLLSVLVLNSVDPVYRKVIDEKRRTLDTQVKSY